jgi:Leucine-rich repeat (LRR) protein
VPAVICTGSSSNLDKTDCFNWISTVRSSAYFAKANPPACQEAIHLEDPCSCTGVIGCSGGRITSVFLGRKGLAFNATDESSLGLLDGLQHIDLNTNGLTGPIPKWLLNLTSINFVWFEQNHLTGTVPAELGALNGLTTLASGGNHLTGTVPEELGALTGLTNLQLNSNQLTGTVPTELGSLTGLTYLSFSSNQLTGTVPAELGALTRLALLHFGGNQLTGTVPALPFKQYTDNCCLSPNKFTCPLPVDAAACICNGKPGVVCN